MNKLLFSKYQGTGNDFILVDNRTNFFPKKNIPLITRLCDRKFGIGSDGLILIQDHSDLDFEMIFLNPDGSKSFCGNGSRCAVVYVKELGIINDTGAFMAVDGIHEFTTGDQTVRVKMSDSALPSKAGKGEFMETGSPHFVQFVSSIRDFPVFKEGSQLRYNSKLFGEAGTNVNFVEELEKGLIFVRTYERGVENETLSCGTGVTAAAIVYGLDKSVNLVGIETLGGKLGVSFEVRRENQITDIYLSGPAWKVFSGEFTIPVDLS